MTNKLMLAVFGIALALGAGGCASKAGNVALGAGAAGAAYELSNKHQIEQLDQEYRDGKISKDEHDRRVQDIKNRSLLN